MKVTVFSHMPLSCLERRFFEQNLVSLCVKLILGIRHIFVGIDRKLAVVVPGPLFFTLARRPTSSLPLASHQVLIAQVKVLQS